MLTLNSDLARRNITSKSALVDANNVLYVLSLKSLINTWFNYLYDINGIETVRPYLPPYLPTPWPCFAWVRVSATASAAAWNTQTHRGPYLAGSLQAIGKYTL